MKFLTVVIISLVLLTTSQSLNAESVVFSRGEGGYYCIKIPSILITSKGSLLAFGEARLFSCGDYTQTDLVYKRSTDNGQTWSSMKILYRGNSTSSNDDFTRVGNVAPVQLKTSERILIPFCKNNLIPMLTLSDDDGVTFSDPQVIPNVTKPDWKWIGFGPPAGLLLQSNRILIPSYYTTLPRDDGLFSTGYVMLNDHDGQLDKWYLGGEFKHELYFPNEAQAVELLPQSNSIFINSRTLETRRIGAFSNDGGISFHSVKLLHPLIQPISGCEGSTIYDVNSRKLFYTGINTKSFVRSNLTLWTSDNLGERWKFVKTIFPGPSAYSALTIMTDQSIGLLYEWANKTRNIFEPDYISFKIIYNTD